MQPSLRPGSQVRITPSGRGGGGRGGHGEIKNPGSSFAAILTSGVWSPGGFRCYIDIRAEESGSIAALLIRALDSVSEDPDVVDKQ